MAGRETIAVLGAGGTMGRAMARNLAEAGHPIRAWNRSRAKAEPLVENGATIHDTPSEATRDAAIVLTILSDADAVLAAVADDALAATGPDAVWLQMSTIGEAGTERCAELAREHSVAFADAPVLGTKQPAEEGKLVVLASGPDELRQRLEPIFSVVGQRTLWVGEAGQGTRLKLASNSWLLAVVEGAAESLAFAEGAGIDPRLLLEAVEGGPLDLPYLQMKGAAMIERKFEPSFRLALAAKDARLVEEAAERHDLDLPVVKAIHARFAAAAAEHPDEDLSATFLLSAGSGART